MCVCVCVCVYIQFRPSDTVRSSEVGLVAH